MLRLLAVLALSPLASAFTPILPSTRAAGKGASLTRVALAPQLPPSDLVSVREAAQ